MTIVIPQEDPQSVNPPRLQPFADESTFGGGPGLAAENQQVQEIAKSTNEIATFEKIRADQTAVQAAGAKLDQIHQQLIDDPETGLHTFKGANAMDGHDKVIAEYQKQANELAKGLQPDQQGAFNRMAVEGGDALNKYAMGYVSDQLEKHDANTFLAGVNQKAQLAGRSYGDPEIVAMYKDQQDKLVNARAIRQGMNPKDPKDEEYANYKMGWDSNFHSSVLGQMVNDPNFQTKANDYFQANKDQMTLDDREKAEKWLSDSSLKSQANSSVAEIMKAHPKSESASLAAADKIEDPDVRTMARQTISSQFSQNRAADKNDKEQTFMNVQDQISKQGLTDPADIRQAIKPTDWENMTGVQRQAILKSGQDMVTSPRMWADYSQAVKNESLGDMSRTDLQTKFLQYASLSDQKVILKSWADGKGDTKNLAPTKTFHEMVDQSAFDAKIVSSPRKADWSDDDYKNWKAFGDEAQQRIEATERAGGKKLSPANQQEIIQKVAIDHTFEKKGWFGSTSQQFEPYTKDFSAQVLNRFPNASEEQIVKAYAMVKNGSKAQDVETFLKSQ